VKLDQAIHTTSPGQAQRPHPIPWGIGCAVPPLDRAEVFDSKAAIPTFCTAITMHSSRPNVSNQLPIEIDLIGRFGADCLYSMQVDFDWQRLHSSPPLLAIRAQPNYPLPPVMELPVQYLAHAHSQPPYRTSNSLPFTTRLGCPTTGASP
jgi:hypothetical protein